MRKSLFVLSGTLLVLAVFLLANIGANNVVIVKAQESSGEKCEKLYECYRSYYNECFDDALNEFVPKKIDAFGIVGLDDEWARLDNLAIEFKNTPKSQIYIVVYGGKANKFGELKERPNRLIHYLTRNRKIDLKKITVINGGYRESFEFELWLSLSEKIFPPLSPTVDPDKTVFKGKMKPLPLDLGT